MKISEIRNKLKDHGIYVSKNTLYDRIGERYGSFLDARKRFLKPVLKQLIIEGYRKQDIEECLETKTKSFLNSWMPKLFGGSSYTTVRQKYLLEMVSTILETGLQDLTHEKIHSFLPLFGEYEIKHLIRNEWEGLISARLQFGREIAICLFRKEKSDEYILKVLGYSEVTIPSQIDRAFKRLFNGMTADEAREHFTSGYKEVEGHFIWYSDLDNY